MLEFEALLRQELRAAEPHQSPVIDPPPAILIRSITRIELAALKWSVCGRGLLRIRNSSLQVNRLLYCRRQLLG
jgi:hypothetical protein